MPYSQRKEDLRLLKAARRRVNTMLIVSLIAVCLYPAAMFFVLEQPLFTKPSFFALLYLGSMLVEMAVWICLFAWCSSGQPASRTVFRIAVLGEFAFGLYLLFDMFRQLDYVVVYLAWDILLLVKAAFLWWLCNWMYSNYWARIYFDHVLEVPQSRRQEKAVQQAMAQAESEKPVTIKARPAPDFAGEQPNLNAAQKQKTRKEKKPLSAKELSARYPRMAIRILAFVVAELIFFPTLLHIFQNSFVSIDNSSVFADNFEFTVSIITTAIWVLPVFFLYLKSPGWKKVFWFTLAAQLVVILFECFVLRRYSQGPVVYSGKVFLQLGMVELARYAILLFGIAPAFRLPEIKDPHGGKDKPDEPIEDDDVIYEVIMEPEEDDEEDVVEDPADELHP